MYGTLIDIQQFFHPKLFVSFLIWLFGYIMSSVVGGIIAFYHFPRVYPETNHPEALPDYGYDLIPYVCPRFFGQNLQSCIVIIFYIAVLVGAIKTPRKGRIIVQQLFHINALAFLARSITVVVTGLPQPNPLPVCIKIQSEHASFKDAISHVVHQFPPGACGDLIFSGHMATIASCMVIFQKYHYLDGPIAYSFGWILYLVGMLSLIACRSHYSIDVILAIYFVYFIKDWYFLRSEISQNNIHKEDEYLTKVKQSSLYSTTLIF